MLRTPESWILSFHDTKTAAVDAATRPWLDRETGRYFAGRRNRANQWKAMREDGWGVERAYVVSSSRLAVYEQAASWARNVLKTVERGEVPDAHARKRLGERLLELGLS